MMDYNIKVIHFIHFEPSTMFLVLFIFGDAHQRQDLLLRVDTATCMLAALISELDRLSREAQHL